MGENVWRYENEWPLKEQIGQIFISEEGNAKRKKEN